MSCSNDRTAKLWQTKQHIPLRIFTGHLSDIDVVEFHPNIHYIATGSNDKQVRLWSCQTGECVRIMIIPNGAVRSLRFSKAGNHLLSGNDYGEIIVFDIVKGMPIEIIQTCQTKAIWSMDISWDDQMLAVGTEEGTIELYNFQKIALQTGKVAPNATDSFNPPRNASYVKNTSSHFIKVFKTKSNGVLLTKFSWRNFLYTIGNYN